MCPPIFRSTSSLFMELDRGSKPSVLGTVERDDHTVQRAVLEVLYTNHASLVLPRV